MKFATRCARNVRITLQAACGLKKGESLVVCATRAGTRYTSAERIRTYSTAFASVASELGAFPVILDLTEFVSTGRYRSGLSCNAITSVLSSADVVVYLSDTLSPARLLGRKGNDDFVLTGTRRHFFVQAHGIERWSIDSSQVRAARIRTRWLAGLLRGAREMRLASPAGTDLVFNLSRGCSCTPVLGIVPLYAEVAVAPREGSGEGLLVVDGPTQRGVRPAAECDRTPLRIQIENGRMRSVSGDREQVSRLRAFVSAGSPRADRIDEIGVPTTRMPENDRFWWSDGTHRCRTVHVALGNNLSRARQVHGVQHMDCEVRYPTVWVDGRKILDRGYFAAGPAAERKPSGD